MKKFDQASNPADDGDGEQTIDFLMSLMPSYIHLYRNYSRKVTVVIIFMCMKTDIRVNQHCTVFSVSE